MWRAECLKLLQLWQQTTGARVFLVCHSVRPLSNLRAFFWSDTPFNACFVYRSTDSLHWTWLNISLYGCCRRFNSFGDFQTVHWKVGEKVSAEGIGGTGVLLRKILISSPLAWDFFCSGKLVVHLNWKISRHKGFHKSENMAGTAFFGSSLHRFWRSGDRFSRHVRQMTASKEFVRFGGFFEDAFIYLFGRKSLIVVFDELSDFSQKLITSSPKSLQRFWNVPFSVLWCLSGRKNLRSSRKLTVLASGVGNLSAKYTFLGGITQENAWWVADCCDDMINWWAAEIVNFSSPRSKRDIRFCLLGGWRYL